MIYEFIQNDTDQLLCYGEVDPLGFRKAYRIILEGFLKDGFPRSYDRVLVCGGRDFTDEDFLTQVLDWFLRELDFKVVIEGDARGADRMAGDWSRDRQLTNVKFRALWDRYGGKAGPIRNAEMLKSGKPDFVIAFPGSIGTADMIRKTQAANLPIITIEELQ